MCPYGYLLFLVPNLSSFVCGGINALELLLSLFLNPKCVWIVPYSS